MLSALFHRFRFSAIAILLSFSALVPALHAQRMHQPGVPASVTSHGFGGHFAGAPGVPASVTSHGSFAPNHFAPNRFAPSYPVRRSFGCCGPVVRRHPGEARFEHRSRRAFFPGAVVYGVPYYPYAYDDWDDYQDEPSSNQNAYNAEYGSTYGEQYNNGPTIFDRSGQGPEYSVPADRAEEQPAAPQAANGAQPNAEPEPLQPATVLVFKDGHQLEVSNYAIVGDTIFDFTPGHSRRVALSELNVQATQKQNDDRGVDFRLPAGAQGG
ncbi:MAG TPA: hypothetical protein VN684_06715 [Terriglobales bacterium]|nr:hypothetical protein [Terriglobales bacterium]